MKIKLLTVKKLFGAAKEPQHFRAGDVEVYQAQAGDGATEVGLVPDVFECRKPSREVIQAPAVHPGENGQEETYLKGENGKDKAEQARGSGGPPGFTG